MIEPELEQTIRRPAGANVARVLAVGIVGWFHIWQQSWVSAGRLDALPRTGYVWVDMMILLSAFCLTLPYGADQIMNRDFRGTAGFWKRRAVRILPAFYLCAVVHLAVNLIQHGPKPGLWKDLIGHLTLTHTWTPEGYYFTQMGMQLWTVGILAGFYLLFPALIRGMWSWPGRMLVGLLLIQAGYGIWALRQEDLVYKMAFNQLPAFAGVLALGMAAGFLYPRLVLQIRGRMRPLFLLGAGGTFVLIFHILKFRIARAENCQIAQLTQRMPLALLFTALVLCLCLGMGGAKRRGLLTVLSGITYSFYLWHQSVAVWLKELHIPAWSGEKPPNLTGDRQWMQQYNLLCWAAALIAAVLCAKLVEKPAARLLMKLQKPRQAEKARNLQE